jgi:hypothetical protein
MSWNLEGIAPLVVVGVLQAERGWLLPITLADLIVLAALGALAALGLTRLNGGSS